MWLALTAWLVAAACVGVAAHHWRKLSALAGDADALLAACRRARRSGRPWTDLLDVAEARDPIAAFNERVGEVARDLAVSVEIPRAAARIGLLSAAVLTVVDISRRLGTPEGVTAGSWLATFAAGAAAAGIGYELHRRSRREAARGREAWNALGAMLRSGPDGPAAQSPD